MARDGQWSVWCCVFFVILRVIRTELLHFDSIDSRKSPSPDFVRHTIIKPKIYHGREKREISSTRENVEGGHMHDLTIGYDVNGTDYVLDLRLNRELIPERFFTRYQHDGRHVVNHPTGRDVQLCQYQGRVRGRDESWAAISTCHGLSGVIFDGEEMHYLQPGSQEEHFLYKQSDITVNQTCGYSGTPHHILENNDFNRILRYKRSSGVIRGPYNANRQSRYVELVLVVDNKEYKELGESITRVNNHCKEIANIINALYQPLNIFVALVGVVVWTETDEISLSHNGDTTLTNFLHYRRERLVKEHPNDNAQLLTRWQFEGGVVGKALKGPICTFEFSGGVSMDHSSVVGLVATTVAHEMGHNLGMEHDTAECNCPSERCIMAPSSSSLSPTQWSSCSLDYLAVAFDHGMDYCLRNKPVSLFDSPVCGNGFVEAGEQCDCGLKDRCNNPCCNATSCMLYSNASCATGECCDLTTCRPKNAGSECRSAYHECDLPEFCTGQGEYCPDDVFKMDGETCDRGKAFCYQGSCRTHTDQCKLLWGPSGKSSDTLCYQMNTNGTRHGNCGFNKLNRSYIKCNDENIYCGMLHCRHLNERLEFGMESVSILSHSFINSGGSIIPCRTAIVDLGLNEVDPGLAPDGAKCGDGKMCVNQKCMAVGSLRHQTGACPMDCNGNGVCNSKGHCHCKVGFSPPHCDYPGTGGSQDSGPASDPNAQRDIMTALYIIFLGIVPLCALVALFVYYTRHRATAFWKKTSLSSDSSPTKPEPAQIVRGKPPVFRERSQALEISSPVNARHGSDNAHASLLSDPNAPVPGFGPPAPLPPAAAAIQSNLLGHFKGFSITPIASPAPLKAAPPPPRLTRSLYLANSASASPALPPANTNSNARPLISAPVLDTTTCTVKELNSVHHPTRPAPEVPNESSSLVEEKPPTSAALPREEGHEEVKEVGSYPTLTRLASFMLRQNSQEVKKPKGKIEKSNSLPKSQIHGVKANKLQIDREALRNIEISNPIPQQDMDLPDSVTLEDLESAKQVVMRAQSMRDNATVKKRSEIPSFGSMRGGKRPTSIPPSARPTSPPPRPPPPPHPGIVGLPGYQNPGEYAYDDCLNLLGEGVAPLAHIDEESPSSGDNIYAVIEESPPNTRAALAAPGGYKTPRPIEGSIESVGLLSEIVNEIQARNVESIYSASKEGNKTSSNSSLGTYVNASNIYRPTGSVYSNMSAQSSTCSSNGYLSPSPQIQPVTTGQPTTSPQPPATSAPSINNHQTKTPLPSSSFSNTKQLGLTTSQPTTSPPATSGPSMNNHQIKTPLPSSFSNTKQLGMTTSQPTTSPSATSGPSMNNHQTKTPLPSSISNTKQLGMTTSQLTTSPQPPAVTAPNTSNLQSRTPLPSSLSNAKQLNVGGRNLGSFTAPVDKVTPAVPLQAKSVSEGYKPYSSALQRSLGPIAASFKNAEASKTATTPPQASVPSFRSQPAPNSVPSSVDVVRDNVESVSKPTKLPAKTVSSVPKPQTNLVPAALKSTVNPPSKPAFIRSPTPPSLGLKQPSNLTKGVQPPSGHPKKLVGVRTTPANSPDLVSSCSNSSNSNKSPDVLGKAPLEKPQPDKLTKPPGKLVGPTPKQPVPKPPERAMKNDALGEKSKICSVSSSFSDRNKLPARNAAGIGKSASDVGKSAKISNVASLQQKFETASSDKDKPTSNITSRTLSNVANNKKRPNIPPSTTSSFKK